MDVWVEPDGEGRWRWGVDDEVHGALVATEHGGIAPEVRQLEVWPVWEVTALLLARQGGGRVCVDHQPPGRLYKEVLHMEDFPMAESPTLGERAARGRQGSL